MRLLITAMIVFAGLPAFTRAADGNQTVFVVPQRRVRLDDMGFCRMGLIDARDKVKAQQRMAKDLLGVYRIIAGSTISRSKYDRETVDFLLRINQDFLEWYRESFPEDFR